MMTRPAHVPDELVVDYDAFGDTSIDEMLEQADRWRQIGPVLWTERNSGHWLVTSSAGCREVLTNTALFNSSSGAGAALVVVKRDPYIPLELDGTEHRAYRRALNPLFAPARVRLLESDVREIARSLLDKIAVNGRSEVVHEYARPLASSMFLRLMDWPLADREMLEDWVERELNGFPGATPEELKKAKFDAMQAIGSYCRGKLKERQANPKDDMTSAVIRAAVDGEPIPDDVLVGMLNLLMIAGLDTTQSVTSRSIGQLAASPDLQQFVRDNPDQLPSIVEELLRVGAPAGPNRTAVVDTRIEGVQIAAGDRVHCMVQAANRDQAEFVHPAVIDFAREVNRHMTFGLGPHKCIGASLARVVIGAALDELHKAIPPYTLASSSSHLGGVWGMRTVEIEFPAHPSANGLPAFS
jgi:cytochrome P450